jgi:hypothetical protein
LLHRVVRAADYARTEEQPLDVIAAVEVEGQLNHLIRSEPGARTLLEARLMQ